MGLLSSFKRIYKTDFEPQYQNLIEQLSNYVNPNTEQLFLTLKNNVTLKDNIYGQVVDIIVKVNENGTPITSVGFTNNLSTPIIGLVVLNCVSTSGSNIFPTAGVFCSFTQNNKNVLINNISGLPANQEFSIKLASFG